MTAPPKTAAPFGNPIAVGAAEETIVGE
jgi:hypothetical protein